MLPYLFFSRLYKLKCCNQNIISLYDQMDSEDESIQNICAKRLEVRRMIKTELSESIDKVRNENRSAAEKPIIYLISEAIMGGFKLMLLCQRKNWQGLYKCELHNLSLYYNALYTPNAPKEIIDSLLTQKNRIEDYMIDA